MPNIYEENNQYYVKSMYGYELCDIVIKRNTIVVMPNGVIVNNLEAPMVYTYKELKNKLIKKR